MWGNLTLHTFNQRSNSTSFLSNKSDILIHLMQWQYWWWFWFSIFFIFYYNLVIKVIVYRSLKFYPKISTSIRPRGRWGDMIIALIPIYWCSNILINSNSLLKVIEWQDSANLITVRVRGKQWYWVYKLSSLSNINNYKLNLLLGNNSVFNLSSVSNGLPTSSLFDFWFKWNNTFFFKNIKIAENLDSSHIVDKKATLGANHVCTCTEANKIDFIFNDYSLSVTDGSLDYFKGSLTSKLIGHSIFDEQIYWNHLTYDQEYWDLNTSKVDFKSGNTPHSVYEYEWVVNQAIKDLYGLEVDGGVFGVTNLDDYLCRQKPKKSNFNNSALVQGNIADTFEVDFDLYKLKLERSYSNKSLVNLLFKDTESLFKKPRYFLTLRQKPVKDWFSYINSGVYSNYNSSIFGQFKKSVSSYIQSHQNTYSLGNNNRLLNTTTLLVLPTNKTISIISNSFDVVHSWFIPGLGIKIDCVPGRSTHHVIKIDIPGFYYGQCAEICGRFHHHMPIKVCALVFEHFLLWWQHYFVYLNLSDNWSDSLLFNRSKYSKFLQ